MTEFMKKWTKKQKIGIASGCAVVLLLIGGSMAINDSYEKNSVSAVEQTSDVAYKKKLDKALEELYTDKSYEKVSDKVTLKQITQMETLLSENPQTKEKMMKTEVELRTGIQMWNIQSKLGTFVDESGLARDGNSNIQLDAVLEALQPLKETKKVFFNEQIKRVSEIKADLTKMNEAKSSVDNLFTDAGATTIKEETTREQLDTVKTQVSALHQAKLKTLLESQLSVVEAQLTERETAVTMVEEQRAQEEQAQKEQQTTTGESNTSNERSNSIGTSGTSTNDYSEGGSAPQQPSAPAPSDGGQGSSTNNDGTWQPPTLNPGDNWEGQENGNTGWITGEGGNTWNEIEW